MPIQRFFQLARTAAPISRAIIHLEDLLDPKIGKQLKALERPTLLIRVDGRSLEKLSSQGGFMPRADLGRIQNLRFADIEKYQQFNEDPFAWGACNSLEDLMSFIEDNASHTNNAWIHKFYGHSTSLATLKIQAGIEISEHDNEKEEVIIGGIPMENFIASTCPRYRTKFLDGKLVPNAMADYNPDLPKSMTMEDLYTEANVLHWLLRNNKDNVFETLCQAVYVDSTRTSLGYRFKEDNRLIDAIQLALGPQSTSLQP